MDRFINFLIFTYCKKCDIIPIIAIIKYSIVQVKDSVIEITHKLYLKLGRILTNEI